MPYRELEIECPHCEAAHVYRLPATDQAPFTDVCDECGELMDIDPVTETASV